MRQRIWILTVMASVMFLAGARAQTPPKHVDERPFDAIPIDYELTSDGSGAVVRGWTPTGALTDVITVWDTSNGQKVVGSGPLFCSLAMPAFKSTSPSDAVRVVGEKAVLIANDGTGNRTLIDVVETAGPSCVANFALPTTPLGLGHNGGEAQ
jgi:hypothetical protein